MIFQVGAMASHRPSPSKAQIAPSLSNRQAAERFFRDLTENQLRRGIFKNLEQLIMAIDNYIDQHNQNPKPFIWTAKASDILEKVTRAQASLDKRLSV
jgi:hypothetical protein